MARFLLVLMLVPWVLMGCSPYESYRQLNDQNKQIGAKVMQMGADRSDADLTQLGADVAANSQTLEDVLDLKPETSVAYTPESSASLRKQAKIDHDSPWYMKAWTWITAGTGALILGYLIKLLRGAGKSNPITALAGDGLAALLDLFKEAGKDTSPASLATKENLAKIIGDLRADEKYGHLVDELLAKYHLESSFPKPEPLT